MNDFWYQLVFAEDCFAPYNMAAGTSFKKGLVDFIYENPLHYGCTDEFFAALDEIDEDDIDQMIELFNEFSCKTIAYIYKVTDIVYPSSVKFNFERVN